MSRQIFRLSYEVICWFSLFSILIIFILYIYHLKQTHERNEENNRNNYNFSNFNYFNNIWIICSSCSSCSSSSYQENIKFILLELFMIASYLFFIIVQIMAIIEMHMENESCLLRVRMIACFFSLSHFCLFNVLIVRLDIVFGDSTFRYSSYILNLVRGLVLCVLITQISLALTLVENAQTVLSDCTFWIRTERQNILWLIIVLDACISILCLALFIKPLFQLLNTAADPKLLDLAVRSTLLTTATVLSTFITFGALSFGNKQTQKPYHLYRINDIVTCGCLLLMNNTFQKCYQILCCGCISCCTYQMAVLKKMTTTERVTTYVKS